MIGENFERECQKRIAGEHGGGLVEGHMNGRPPAPEIVVVHAGEIVMHERIGVHGLDRRSHPKRARRINVEEFCTAQHEERAQPLAAGEDGVTHRLVNAGVKTVRPRQKLHQCLVDRAPGRAHGPAQLGKFARPIGRQIVSRQLRRKLHELSALFSPLETGPSRRFQCSRRSSFSLHLIRGNVNIVLAALRRPIPALLQPGRIPQAPCLLRPDF